METKKIEEVIEEFDFAGELTECIPYGNGHINDTLNFQQLNLYFDNQYNQYY